MKNKMRWAYLTAGTLMLLCLGLIYAWSIFRKPIMQVYPDWSLPQISMTFTISIICFCTGGLLGGKLSLRMKPKGILLISAALLFVGFFSVSFLNPEKEAESLIMIYILYGGLGGTGVGIGYNIIISTVCKWFPDRQGFASGILLMGFGVGAIVLGTLVNIMIEEKGLFLTFRYLAILIGAIIIVGAIVIKRPEEMETAYNEEGKSYTLKEMINTKIFWNFVIWMVLLNTIGLVIINSAASIALKFGAPAVLGLMISVFNGIGRTTWGISYDKKGKTFTIGAITTVAIVAGILLYIGGTYEIVEVILLGMLLVGLMYGGSPTMSAAFIRSQFGPKYFPVNFSVANFSLIPAALIGPLVSSKLIEKSNGEYKTSFIMIIAIGVAAFILYIILMKSIKEKK